jgi:hypothetical protein
MHHGSTLGLSDRGDHSHVQVFAVVTAHDDDRQANEVLSSCSEVRVSAGSAAALGVHCPSGSIPYWGAGSPACGALFAAMASLRLASDSMVSCCGIVRGGGPNEAMAPPWVRCDGLKPLPATAASRPSCVFTALRRPKGLAWRARVPPCCPPRAWH